MPDDFTVVIDTREKRPYSFPCQTVRATLVTGDYSVLGMEDRVCVERKRVQELFQCVGRERKRLVREMERLAKVPFPAIVVEGRLASLLKPAPFSQVTPKSVINTLVSWSVKYKVHVFFADDRHLARALTYRILQQCRRHLDRGGAA